MAASNKTGLGAAWVTVKRSANLDEIWKIKIYVKSLGSVYNVKLLRYDKETQPIIYEIVRCFEKFYSEFIKKDGNYRYAKMFENSSLTFGLQNNRYLDWMFFGPGIYARNKRIIENLTIKDFYMGERFKSFQAFTTEFNLELSPIQFLTCTGMAQTARTRYQEGEGSDLCTIINRYKRRGKFFRKFLLPDPQENIRITLTNLRKQLTQ